MSDYQTLRKIIPADQALASQALSRGLGQVKNIFSTVLPSLGQVVINLESNKDLGLINALTQPLPANVANYYTNVLATGTGPGNTITVNDVIGIASGNTTNTELPTVISTLYALGDAGALDGLTADGGMPASAINGAYTVMQYCLANAYTSSNPGPPPDYTITIPAPLPGAGTYGPDENFGNVIDAAFVALISSTDSRISNIATAYPEEASNSNASFANIATQISYNIINCVAAGIDIANVTNNMANANLEANNTSSTFSFIADLHEIGQDVTTGGQSQFVQQISNVSTLGGQAVVASMREGRNITILNAVGIPLDTQIPAAPQSITIANSIGSAQYTVAQARANIVI